MNKIAGFTLMEILIAMAIMGIIAGVGFSSYSISIQKTHDAARKSDLNQISKALEAYQADFGLYPASQTNFIAGCGDGTAACSWGGQFNLDTGKIYMPQLPAEIRSAYFYVYLASTDRKKYQLFANLENTKDPSVISTLSVICSTNNDVCNYGISSSNTTISEDLQ